MSAAYRTDGVASRAACLALDAADPLAPLRDRFDLPEGVIYLDGNSLGARPRAALERTRTVVADEWGRGLIRSWNSVKKPGPGQPAAGTPAETSAPGWFALPGRLGDRIAPLLGAQAGEVVVTDTTSLNLFKALAAALSIQAERAPARKVLVTERANFPTDIYMADGLAHWLDRGYRLHLVDAHDDLDAAVGADCAVLMLTHVDYRTGRQHDMAALTALAHARGALAVWDLAHSAGAVPLDLHGAGADFAVGCTYKYLNGGPGAPAFIWVPRRHQAAFRHPLTGWWSHAAPFAMAYGYEAAQGIGRALCGTQPVVSLALVECGLEVFEATGMAALRAKSLALTDLFIALVERRCGAHPLGLVTPRAHAQRGSQVSLTHPHGYAVMQALVDRGVIGDYREPEIMRFGFAPLYTRFSDVWDAVDTLGDILDRAAYDTRAAAEVHSRAVT